MPKESPQLECESARTDPSTGAESFASEFQRNDDGNRAEDKVIDRVKKGSLLKCDT